MKKLTNSMAFSKRSRDSTILQGKSRNTESKIDQVTDLKSGGTGSAVATDDQRTINP